MSNQLLQPDDSKRVADELIKQIKRVGDVSVECLQAGKLSWSHWLEKLVGSLIGRYSENNLVHVGIRPAFDVFFNRMGVAIKEVLNGLKK